MAISSAGGRSKLHPLPLCLPGARALLGRPGSGPRALNPLLPPSIGANTILKDSWGMELCVIKLSCLSEAP